ncbi:hypothetical protein OI18_11090 [Flavihumibacter solisilvae]|uniref:Glycosyl transferase n=1 Tax=Flavihumibacter solisilvae TaxID=1349421 RepID=A0A0C1IKH9_9BACT|nr:hypothetical protein OI18_11090 [Flavihumibacter solisilvae]
MVNYVNVHAYHLSFKDQAFRNILNRSDIVFCDGFGVKLGAKMLGLRLGERMTPPDWIDELFAMCENEKVSIYFLGDEDYVVKRFTEMVGEKFPNLRIAGYNNGFFSKSSDENNRVINDINASGAEILITGMGMPLQEKWAFEHREQLRPKVVIGAGALFRWYAKIEKRGPRIVTDNGFEWLWRLFVQPKKVWKRYIIELPYFFMVVLKYKFTGK